MKHVKVETDLQYSAPLGEIHGDPEPGGQSPPPPSGITEPQEGVDLLTQTASPTDVPTKTRALIQQLWVDVDHLEAAIRKVEAVKSKLSDWFLEQMLAANDGCVGEQPVRAQSSVVDIKNRYKKHNAELKGKLAQLKCRLEDTQLALSKLETLRVYEDFDDAQAYIAQILANNGRQDSSAAMSPSSGIIEKKPLRMEDLDSLNSLTAKSPKIAKHSLNPKTISPSSRNSTSAAIGDSVKEATPDISALPLPSCPSKSLTTPTESLLPKNRNVTTSAEIPHTSFQSDEKNSYRITQRRPVLSAKGERPSSGSSNSTNVKHHFRDTLKQNIGNLFARPFVRRSEVVTSPHSLKRSASDERLSTLPKPSPLRDEGHSKLSSTMNNRIFSPNSGTNLLGFPTTSKAKKSNRHGNNGGANDHPIHSEVGFGGKKSQARSNSSSVAGYPSHHQAESITATSGGGSDRSCPPDNEAVTSLLSSNHATFLNILDVLHGGSGGIRLPRSSVGKPVAPSGVGSNHSGGAAAAAGLPARVPLGLSTPNDVIAFPSAYNMALAWMILYQQIQDLLKAQEEVQQKITSELREELSLRRQDLTETRNNVNVLTVEIEAVRLDMQTKDDVQNQTLSNAIARLEQLDASSEKWRQSIRHDLIVLQNEHKHALDALKYQFVTETRDLRDMFNTLNNKVAIMEKSEVSSNLDRYQARPLHIIANTLTNLVVSIVAFITALIQILLRFLNAGAIVTNSRASVIVLNMCLLIVLLVIFLAHPLYQLWSRSDIADSSAGLPHQ